MNRHAQKPDYYLIGGEPSNNGNKNTVHITRLQKRGVNDYICTGKLKYVYKKIKEICKRITSVIFARFCCQDAIPNLYIRI